MAGTAPAVGGGRRRHTFHSPEVKQRGQHVDSLNDVIHNGSALAVHRNYEWNARCVLIKMVLGPAAVPTEVANRRA